MARRPIQFAVATLLALLSALVATHVVTSHGFAWIDLDVYRWAGDVALDTPNLYETRHPTLGMPFTYTPFAALCFVALAAAQTLTPVIWTALSIAALLRMSWLLAKERDGWWASAPTICPAIAIAAAVVISQPGSATIRLGQVGFILPWLICEDLLVERRRAGGLGIGIATALKLTPGAFLPFLILVGRWRMLATSSAVIAATVLAGWIAMPVESRTFWRHLGPDVTTVGPVATKEHWSINGAMWRVFGDGGNQLLWLALALVTFIGSLLLARLWWCRGGRAGAIGVVGLGAVLASPFSWSHHWVIVAPLFVGLLGASAESTHRLPARVVLATCFALLATGLWWHLPRWVLSPLSDAGLTDQLASNVYLLVAALLFSLAWRLRPIATEASANHTDSGRAQAESQPVLVRSSI
jgi:alpha-1,2-mannosyltransferase